MKKEKLKDESKKLKDISETNEIIISGIVASECTFSHTMFGEDIYSFDVVSKRLSGNEDVIPVHVLSRTIDNNAIIPGKYVEISGCVRTHNDVDGKLKVYVIAREMIVLEYYDDGPDKNSVFLDGYICKQPVYRMTPLGREIADILLAVNRPHGKSDYIPCICWGRNARFAGKFQVGDHIQLRGRIQSRTYHKKIAEDTVENRTAYEISASSIEVVHNENQ